MKKKEKLIVYSIVAVAGIAFLGTSSVYAMGGPMWRGTPEEMISRQSTMFSQHAELLGISVDEVKEYWAEGKNIREIAEAKGIDIKDIQSKIREKRKTEMKERLQVFVDNGVITQAQAERRLEIMQNHEGKFPEGIFSRENGRRGPPLETEK